MSIIKNGYATYWVTQEQKDYLTELSKKYKKTKSELVREGIDLLIEKYKEEEK